jgi:cytosine deaminase
MSSQSYDLILRHCRLLRSPNSLESVDIAIQAGKIAAIAPHIEATALQELDVQGQLVSPPFVESHIHLDSASTAGEPRWNQSGTLFEGIEIWRERKQSLTLEDVKQRAIATLKQQAMQGALFVRSHAE